jgi:Tol biopolymer transport system component
VLVSTTDIGRDMVLLDTMTDATSVIDVPGEVRGATFRPPDDREIVYVIGDPSAGDRIYVVDRDGRTAPRSIASASEIGAVRYAPDGSWIAYQAYTAADDRWTAHVVRSDGSGDTVLAHPPNVVEQGAPDWSPDGETLLIFRNYDDGTSRVAMVRPDGSTVREYRLATVFGDRIFSPDGTKILNIPNEFAEERGFCSLDAPGCPVVLVDVKDGSLSKLPVPAAVEETVWQRRAPD